MYRAIGIELTWFDIWWAQLYFHPTCSSIFTLMDMSLNCWITSVLFFSPCHNSMLYIIKKLECFLYMVAIDQEKVFTWVNQVCRTWSFLNEGRMYVCDTLIMWVGKMWKLGTRNYNVDVREGEMVRKETKRCSYSSPIASWFGGQSRCHSRYMPNHFVITQGTVIVETDEVYLNSDINHRL